MPIDPSIIVTTIGGTNSNSYVTLAEFIDYADMQLGVEPYRTASVDDRIRALLMAAQRLDRENWLGSPVSTAQALAWPRNDVRRPNQVYSFQFSFWNDTFRFDEIPRVVKFAQYELAFAYLDGFEQSSDRDIDQFTTDGITIKYGASGGSEFDLPPRVASLIGRLIQGNRLIRA